MILLTGNWSSSVAIYHKCHNSILYIQNNPISSLCWSMLYMPIITVWNTHIWAGWSQLKHFSLVEIWNSPNCKEASSASIHTVQLSIHEINQVCITHLLKGKLISKIKITETIIDYCCFTSSQHSSPAPELAGVLPHWRYPQLHNLHINKCWFNVNFKRYKFCTNNVKNVPHYISRNQSDK